jgi:hypothetical protein
MSMTTGAASIIAHLGGEDFLVNLGARDFVVDDAYLSFTLVHRNPKGVHSVRISVESNKGFNIVCYGRIVPRLSYGPRPWKGERAHPRKSGGCSWHARDAGRPRGRRDRIARQM